MDGIIDTVVADHPIAPLINMLKTQGKLVILGGASKPIELQVFPLIMGELTTLLVFCIFLYKRLINLGGSRRGSRAGQGSNLGAMPCMNTQTFNHLSFELKPSSLLDCLFELACNCCTT